MSTHNICFHGEIRKMLSGYPVLSRVIVLAELLVNLECTQVIEVMLSP